MGDQLIVAKEILCVGFLKSTQAFVGIDDLGKVHDLSGGNELGILTLERQSGTSILNIFPATVDELILEGQAQVTVRLMVGGVPMLARVTRKSAALLDLKPGKQVYAQAKSVALLS